MTGSTPTPAEEPSGRWRVLALLVIASTLAMTTWFSATAVLPQLREEWGLASGSLALLTISVQLGFVAGAVVSATLNLADLVAPRTLFFLSALGAAAVNGLLYFSEGAASALPLRFATGALLAGVYAPALKMMSTWFTRGRGLALGLVVGGLVLGQGTPHLINAVGGADWRLVVVVTSALTACGALVVRLAVREGPFRFPAAVFDPRQIRCVFTDRGVRLAALGYLGHMWELFAMYAWFAVFFTSVLVDHGIADPSTGASLATFSVIATGAVGCWVGGVMADRWGRTRTTMLSMAISGSCAILIGLTIQGPVILTLIVGLVWGFWVVSDSAQFSTVVTEVAQQRYVGTALTLQLALGFTLTVLTIWLVPVVQEALTWRWAFAVLAAGPAVGVWAMYRLMRSPEAAKIAGGLG